MNRDRESRRRRLLAGERTNWRGDRDRVLYVLTGLGVAALAVSIVLPRLNRPPRLPVRAKCRKQLQAIGQAMVLYAQEHGGRYPASADELIITQDIAPGIFVCPASMDEPAAPGATPLETAANVAAPGHLSYTILSKGLSGQPPADI